MEDSGRLFEASGRQLGSVSREIGSCAEERTVGNRACKYANSLNICGLFVGKMVKSARLIVATKSASLKLWSNRRANGQI